MEYKRLLVMCAIEWLSKMRGPGRTLSQMTRGITQNGQKDGVHRLGITPLPISTTVSTVLYINIYVCNSSR